MKAVSGRAFLAAVLALICFWLGSQRAQCAEQVIDGKPEKPKRFYDNSIIQEVNREYVVKLFPGEIR
jgi:hypothetical protein